jgi:hypothetical protein
MFWSNYHRGSRGACADLVGDRRPGYTILAGDLSAYACNRAVGLQCAKDGDARGEECYLGIAEKIYLGLPADLRGLVREQ